MGTDAEQTHDMYQTSRHTWTLLSADFFFLNREGFRLHFSFFFSYLIWFACSFCNILLDQKQEMIISFTRTGFGQFVKLRTDSYITLEFYTIQSNGTVTACIITGREFIFLHIFSKLTCSFYLLPLQFYASNFLPPHFCMPLTSPFLYASNSSSEGGHS